MVSPPKRLALVGFFAGSGVVFALALIWAAVHWCTPGPTEPEPWNSEAIIATFNYPDVEGPTSTIVLNYVIENTTNSDYRIPQSLAELNGLGRDGVLFPVGSAITIDEDYSVLPPNQRRAIRIHLVFPMTADLGSDANTREDRRRRARMIADFVASEFGNLNGFVLFDSKNHYRINFPNGWDPFDSE